MARLVATGLPIPRPFWAQAEIDTGAYPTAIALPVPTGFGLSPSGQGRNRTAAGSVPVDLYRVSLGLPPMFGLATTTVLAHDLEVSALAHPIPGTDLLIGFDLILNCRLLIDGPGRTFTLDF
ncbi:MAG TPA: hypothetical protein VFG68_21090 [Fimbriiglobus sp.]|nr:hypothetical protein [Fimbriiglobus sp.]